MEILPEKYFTICEGLGNKKRRLKRVTILYQQINTKNFSPLNAKTKYQNAWKQFLSIWSTNDLFIAKIFYQWKAWCKISLNPSHDSMDSSCGSLIETKCWTEIKYFRIQQGVLDKISRKVTNNTILGLFMSCSGSFA